MDNLNTFNGIYLQYRRNVFKVLLELVKDRQAAEDLSQETFLALHIHGPGNFSDSAGLRRWLIKTATHKAYNYLKRSGKVIPVSKETLSAIGIEESAFLALEEEEEERSKALHRAVDSLPEDYRALIILYYFLQVPQAELAAALELPPGTVKSRLSRARRLLKAHLNQQHN